jgi:hypothetical protein
MVRLCIDCKWHRAAGWLQRGLSSNRGQWDLCKQPEVCKETTYDRVIGPQPTATTRCFDARLDRGVCGKAAKYWEPK